MLFSPNGPFSSIAVPVEAAQETLARPPWLACSDLAAERDRQRVGDERVLAASLLRVTEAKKPFANLGDSSRRDAARPRTGKRVFFGGDGLSCAIDRADRRTVQMRDTSKQLRILARIYRSRVFGWDTVTRDRSS